MKLEFFNGNFLGSCRKSVTAVAVLANSPFKSKGEYFSILLIILFTYFLLTCSVFLKLEIIGVPLELNPNDF